MHASPAKADSSPPPGTATACNRIDYVNARRALLALCIAHVLLWTLVPALSYPSAPEDTLEAIAWGELWQFGYDKHPPLAPWISALFTDAFDAVGWPAYLAAELCVALTFWAVWTLAVDIVASPWRAFVAVCLLEGVAFFNTPLSFNASSFILNPNTLTLPTWAMLALSSHRAIRKPNAARWAHAGLWAALALLAKYSSGLLLMALAFVMIATAEGRRCLATPTTYIGLLVALAVLSPHLAWLLQHDFLPFRYAAGMMDTTALPVTPRGGGIHHWYQPLLFLRAQLGYVAAALLLFLLLKRRRQAFDRRQFDHVFVATLTFGPLLAALTIGFAGHAYLVTAWGYPLYSLLGLYLVLFHVPEVDRRQLTRLTAAVAALSVALALHLAWSSSRHPWEQAVFPYESLLAEITADWGRHYDARLRVIAGDRWTVAGLATYSRGAVTPYFDWNPVGNPWLREADIQETGAVFVHRLTDEAADKAADEALILSLKARFPRLTGERTVVLAPLAPVPATPLQFWIARLPPAYAEPTERPQVKH